MSLMNIYVDRDSNDKVILIFELGIMIHNTKVSLSKISMYQNSC